MLVVGAGQAGLAVAYHLQRAGLGSWWSTPPTELGASWRNRWDSLTLFTPAQYDALPGMDFPAPADAYPTRTAGGRLPAGVRRAIRACPSGSAPA